jgi:hypothetical protein
MEEFEEKKRLEDRLPWRDLYPGLPTVEAARGDANPTLWIKTDNPRECAYSFFVAGYTRDEPTDPVRAARIMLGFKDFDAVSFYEQRYFGLQLDHVSEEIEWVEVDDHQLQWEGPGAYIVEIDESWEPRPASSVFAQYRHYAIVTPEQRRDREREYEWKRDMDFEIEP